MHSLLKATKLSPSVPQTGSISLVHGTSHDITQATKNKKINNFINPITPTVTLKRIHQLPKIIKASVDTSFCNNQSDIFTSLDFHFYNPN